MKKVFSLVFAGIIGGMITLGGFLYIGPINQNISQSEFDAKPVQTNFNLKTANRILPFDFTDAAEKAMPVVVHISAKESEDLANQRRQKDDPLGQLFGDDFFFGSPFDMPQRPMQGSGSGVIISDDGYIVTNNHVVEFADELEVVLYDNRTFRAEVIGKDPHTDMAVIKIDAQNLPTLDYANSDNAKVGEWVLAVGNPFDLTSTVTAGIISAKGRDINIISGNRSIESFIQTDAAVNPGNSGGALIDAQGNLLGINTAIATRTGSFSGYSFAIPVNIMQKIATDMIEYGSYQRAFLGINISEMDSERAEELGLNITQGVFIEELVDGGAAQFAGLLPTDIIIKVDDRPIKTVPELQEAVGSAKVGDTLKVSVNREGRIKHIPVKLKAG